MIKIDTVLSKSLAFTIHLISIPFQNTPIYFNQKIIKFVKVNHHGTHDNEHKNKNC